MRAENSYHWGVSEGTWGDSGESGEGQRAGEPASSCEGAGN